MSLRGPLEVTQASPVPVGHPRGVVILEPADQPDLLTKGVQPAVHVPADAFQPVDYIRRSNYRTSSPVTARPISIRWISLVPPKIVKIVD